MLKARAKTFNGSTWKHRVFLYFFCYVVISFPAFLYAKDNKKAVYVDYPYAINLESTLKKPDINSIPNLAIFRDYRIYTNNVTLSGKTWTRLRLGFFKTKQDALAAQKKIEKYYSESWIAIVSEQERENSIKTAIVLNGRKLPSAVSIEEKKIVETPVEETPVITPRSDALSIGVASAPAAAEVTISTTTGAEPSPIEPASDKPTKPSTLASNNTGSVKKTGKTAKLLELARSAFTAGDYQKTIQLTTAILELPKSNESQDALELLGLARERNGQVAHAKAEYQKYLTLYPEGEDAERVSQRLAGLVTAASKPTTSSRQAKSTRKRGPAKWQSFGSFSQYYYRDERSVDDEENIVDLDSLITTFDMSGRKRSEDYNHRYQITGDYAYDFIDDESDGRFSRLFYEMTNRNNNNGFKVGRQTYSEGGVLGLFDGAILGLGVTQKSRVNLAAGYLLDIDDLLDFSYTKDRKFASLNVDFGNEFKNWDISFYFMQQMVDEIIDRQAIGGEARYFNTNFNIFNLIDYDISYDELNIFLLNANWVVPQQGNLFATIDIRKVPYLSTSNALQGQTTLTMEELLNIFSEEEVRQLALDRTATSHTFTAGGSKQLNGFLKGHGQYQVSGDFTYNTISEMPASGGVAAVPSTGDNYFIGGQFIGSSIIKRGDTSIFSLRMGFTEISDDVTVSFDTRYPVTEKFRINPRIQYFRRAAVANDNLLKTLRFSLKADYRPFRSMLVEGEVGLDNTDDQVGGITVKSDSLFWYVGYRLDF